MENVQRVFDRMDTIDYQHREGGRYAYVQLMALLRDLQLELQKQGDYDQEQERLRIDGDILNELVHLRFEVTHREIFEAKMRGLQEMRQRIFLSSSVLKSRVEG